MTDSDAKAFLAERGWRVVETGNDPFSIMEHTTGIMVAMDYAVQIEQYVSSRVKAAVERMRERCAEAVYGFSGFDDTFIAQRIRSLPAEEKP